MKPFSSLTENSKWESSDQFAELGIGSLLRKVIGDRGSRFWIPISLFDMK